MSNNKQSSVESLFEKLWDTPKDKFTWYAILEEHIATHEQEIMNSFVMGLRNWDSELMPEDYYKQTFNK